MSWKYLGCIELTIFLISLSLSSQAFVPNQVKPYICTTKVPPALICQIQDQAQGFKWKHNIRQTRSITQQLLHWYIQKRKGSYCINFLCGASYSTSQTFRTWRYKQQCFSVLATCCLGRWKRWQLIWRDPTHVWPRPTKRDGCSSTWLVSQRFHWWSGGNMSFYTRKNVGNTPIRHKIMTIHKWSNKTDCFCNSSC